MLDYNVEARRRLDRRRQALVIFNSVRKRTASGCVLNSF